MKSTARRAAVVAASLVLIWRVLEVNVAAYDADGVPKPPALPSGVSAAPSDDRALLKRALHDNPAHVEALLLLARDQERAAEGTQAGRAYRVALQLAPVDREVLGAAAEFFIRQGADGETLILIDRLVAAYPDARPTVFPVLARMLEQGSATSAWNEILARKPQWLGPFIVASCEAGVDPSFLAPMLLERVAAGRPPAAPARPSPRA